MIRFFLLSGQWALDTPVYSEITCNMKNILRSTPTLPCDNTYGIISQSGFGFLNVILIPFFVLANCCSYKLWYRFSPSSSCRHSFFDTASPVDPPPINPVPANLRYHLKIFLYSSTTSFLSPHEGGQRKKPHIVLLLLKIPLLSASKLSGLVFRG